MFTKSNQAVEFFEVHVKPNLSAWSVQQTDIRLAMNAVLSLYHMADHYWHAYQGVDPDRVFKTACARDFRARLAKMYRHFAILRDVAEAHKHVELDRSHRVLTNAAQTKVGVTGFGEAGFGTGPFGGGHSLVVLLDDNSKHHFFHLLEQVRDLWLTKLA